MSLSGDRIYLFDTSIWDHTTHPLIVSDWEAAVQKNQLAVSPIVAFEVLYIAQNQADFEELERQLSGDGVRIDLAGATAIDARTDVTSRSVSSDARRPGARPGPKAKKTKHGKARHRGTSDALGSATAGPSLVRGDRSTAIPHPCYGVL